MLVGNWFSVPTLLQTAVIYILHLFKLVGITGITRESVCNHRWNLLDDVWWVIRLTVDVEGVPSFLRRVVVFDAVT